MTSLESLELTVYGYIKELKLFADVPDVIKDVIVEFATFYFDWKDSKYREGDYEFHENPAVLTRLTHYGWSFLALKNVLSLDVCNKLEWELKITKKMHRGIPFAFGFVESPMRESIKNFNIRSKIFLHFFNSRIPKYQKN